MSARESAISKTVIIKNRMLNIGESKSKHIKNEGRLPRLSGRRPKLRS